MHPLITGGESERSAALREYQILDTPPEASFDDLIRLASIVCQAPIALLNIVDRDRNWFKAKLGIDFGEMPRGDDFCQEVLQTGDLVVVPDATADPRYAGMSVVTGPPAIRFYAGVPLRSPRGPVVGTLSVADTVARELSADQRAALWALARQAISQLELRRSLASRAQAEAALRESEERFRQLAEHITEIFWICDTQRGELLYVSPAHRDIWGAEILPLPLPLAAVQDAIQPLMGLFEAPETYFRTHEIYDTEHLMIRPDGTARWLRTRGYPIRDAQGQIYRVAGISEDITARKQIEDQLLHDTLHDALTKLPNRTLVVDRLATALEWTRRRPDYRFAVLFVDLDRFKLVNDSLGHELGDQLLVTVSRRLVDCLRPTDTVGRMSGDEFVILIEEIADLAAATLVAERIHATLAEPVTLEGHQIVITPSIGIMVSGPGYSRPDEVLRDADIALHRAKANGKARFEVFDRAMHAQLVARLQLEADLRGALERNALELYYQPIVELESGKIVGLEALLRWQHEQHGFVSPAEFVPIAEETGLIVPLGRWVLETACRQTRAWHQAGLPEVTVAVNISERQFRQAELRATVAALLAETGLAPQCLKLELTESSAMHDAAATTATLHDLKTLGIQISIDDFGTGYSSLSYLTRFPIDTLKIDRSFVQHIGVLESAAAIAEAIIAMAHSLNLRVVAEGVETASQLAFLQTHSCDAIQGYLFSRPLPAAAVEAVLSGTTPLQLPAPAAPGAAGAGV